MARIRLKRLQASLAKTFPQSWVNSFLLSFPRLYKTRFIGYESYLTSAKQEILDALSLPQSIEGNIVEFGSARCGTSALIGNLLKQNTIPKKIYAMDTFGAGFDKGELARERSKGLTDVKEEDFTGEYNSFAYVQAKIRLCNLSDTSSRYKGYFNKPSIRYRDRDVISSTMHIHLDESRCLEIISVKGKLERIQTMAKGLMKTKGVSQFKLSTISL